MNNDCTLIMSYANLSLRMQEFVSNIFLACYSSMTRTGGRGTAETKGKYTNSESGAILPLTFFFGAMIDLTHVATFERYILFFFYRKTKQLLQIFMQCYWDVRRIMYLRRLYAVKDLFDAKSSVISLIMHVHLPTHSHNIIVSDVK